MASTGALLAGARTDHGAAGRRAFLRPLSSSPPVLCGALGRAYAMWEPMGGGWMPRGAISPVFMGGFARKSERGSPGAGRLIATHRRSCCANLPPARCSIMQEGMCARCRQSPAYILTPHISTFRTTPLHIALGVPVHGLGAYSNALLCHYEWLLIPRRRVAGRGRGRS